MATGSLQKKAGAILSWAIDRGRVVRGTSCELCGMSGYMLNGHHDDYWKPLEVRWFCPQCHIKWHLKHGPARGADMSSLAMRVERGGPLHRFRRKHLDALCDSIAQTGGYLGPDGMIPANKVLLARLDERIKSRSIPGAEL